MYAPFFVKMNLGPERLRTTCLGSLWPIAVMAIRAKAVWGS